MDIWLEFVLEVVNLGGTVYLGHCRLNLVTIHKINDDNASHLENVER